MKKYEVCIFGYGSWPKKFLNNLDSKFNVKYIISNRKNSDVRVKKFLLTKDFNDIDIFFLAKDFNSNYDFFMKHKSKIRNIIFEKPLSNKVFKIKRILKECKKYKIKCLISYPLIYSKLFNKIISLSNKKVIKKISFINQGDGPIRKYIDPINDYIPITIVVLFRILKMPKIINLSDHTYVLKSHRKKTIIEIKFKFNNTIVEIITGNNSKLRKSQLNVDYSNGSKLSTNILKNSIRVSNELKINYKNYDNISKMLEYLMSKDNKLSSSYGELKNEIMFYNFKNMILPIKYHSF